MNQHAPRAVSILVAERQGLRAIPANDRLSPRSNAPPPAAGDSMEPNNLIGLDDTNGFCAAVRCTLGAEAASDTLVPVKEEVSVLPGSVDLKFIVSAKKEIFVEVSIAITNSLATTAAAQVDIPRVPGLVLLEEVHVVDGIRYLPQVTEKLAAQAAYEAAANSQTHSATLSSSEDDAIQVQLDKVPKGSQATCTLTFLAIGGLRQTQAVMSDADEDAAVIADLAIIAPWSPLDTRGVPFSVSVSLPPGLEPTLPSAEVMHAEASLLNSLTLAGGSAGREHVHASAIVHLAPSLHDSGEGQLTWSHAGGLARGTVVKLRISESHNEDVISALGSLAVSSDVSPQSDFLGPSARSVPGQVVLSPSGELEGVLSGVDTVRGVTHSRTTGAPLDASLVQVSIPTVMPGVAPSAAPHEVVFIVDTSGSTAMWCGGGPESFQDKAKHLLQSALDALPHQVAALRAAKLINNEDVNVHLWQFNSTTHELGDVVLRGCGADGFAGAKAVLPLKSHVSTFRPGGSTNYDSWSATLRAHISARPSHLFSVLLITDGGATSRQTFFDEITRISAMKRGSGFLQVDCVGYGPWLDQRTVTHAAGQTGGEAIMVEEPTGQALATKLLGLVARSMLRAAGRLTLAIEGDVDLLAVANDSGADGGSADEKPLSKPPLPTSAPSLLDPSSHIRTEFTSILPGSKLQLSLLHSSGQRPQLTLAGIPLQWPHQNLSPSASGGMQPSATPSPATASPAPPGWHLVDLPTPPSGPNSPPPSASVSSAAEAALSSRLERREVRAALLHLPILEPAFAREGSVHWPQASAAARGAVALAISLSGQVAAPSVTKAVAVAELSSTLQPVPEHCRPAPCSLRSLFVSTRRQRFFEDDPSPHRPSAQSFPVAGCRESMMGTSSGRFGRPPSLDGGGSGFRASDEEDMPASGCCAPAFGLTSAPVSASLSLKASLKARMSTAAHSAPRHHSESPQDVNLSGAALLSAPMGAPPMRTPPSAPRPSSASRPQPTRNAEPPTHGPELRRKQACGPQPFRSNSFTSDKEETGPPRMSVWLRMTRGGLLPACVDQLAVGDKGLPRLCLTSLQASLERTRALVAEGAASASVGPACCGFPPPPSRGVCVSSGEAIIAHATSAFALQHQARAADASPGLPPGTTLAAHVLRLLQCAQELLAEPANTDDGVSFDIWRESLFSQADEEDRKSCLQPDAMAVLLAACDMVLSHLCASPGTTLPRWPWLRPPDDTSPPPLPTPTKQGHFPSPVPTLASRSDAISGRVVHVSEATATFLAERARQEELFSAAVKRDCYTLLLRPRAPHEEAALPTRSAPLLGGTIPFAVHLSTPPALADVGNAPRQAFVWHEVGAALPRGFGPVTEPQQLEALAALGGKTPLAHALTAAFEDFLKTLAREVWTPTHVRAVSVQFLVAFSAELTPRLDVHHRIRSTALTSAEQHTLSSAPFATFVDQSTLTTFQTAGGA